MKGGLVHLAAWYSTEFDEVPTLRYLCSGWFAFTRCEIELVTCPECLAQWTIDALKEPRTGEEEEEEDD